MIERSLVASIDAKKCVMDGKFAAYLFETPTCLIGLLRTWSFPPLSLAGRELRTSYVYQSYASGPKSFADFPVELIDMVFLELRDTTACLGLALTCWQCLRVGEKHIRKRAQAFVGPWAGHRLVCPGSELEDDDLPPQLRTADVQKALAKGGDNLYYYTADNFTPPGRLYWLRSSYSKRWVSRISDAERQIVHAIERQYKAPRGQPLVLRNLSRRVYVAETALGHFNQYLQTKNTQCLGLDTVLMTHICWSDLDPSDLKEEGYRRGEWAGDRFDIVAEDAVLKCIASGETWTDVGKEIVETVIDIWRQNASYNFKFKYDSKNAGSEGGDADDREKTAAESRNPQKKTTTKKIMQKKTTQKTTK